MNTTTQANELPRGRVVSIDVLRGFDMFWIIGGGTFFGSVFKLIDSPIARTLERQLHHAAWHGFHFEDLIFPLFLFIVGLSLPFALKKRIDRGDSRGDILCHVLKRTAILYFLGLVYYGFFDLNFGELRYVGVLQRIALCYFFASLIVLHSGMRGQAIWTVSLLVFYWLAITFIPVPGYGAGFIAREPLEGNLVGFFDRMVLPGSLYMKVFDPEGLLSTIPAVSTTLLGVLSARLLSASMTETRKVAVLSFAGIASLVLGLVWGMVFPINKYLWTSSFVLFAGGWSMLLLALFYWIVDVKGYQRWAFPFVIIGLNPITIYVASRFINFTEIGDIFVHGFARYSGDFQPVIVAAAGIIVQLLFLYFLYRKKLFLKA